MTIVPESLNSEADGVWDWKKVTETELQPVLPTYVIVVCVSCLLNHKHHKSSHHFALYVTSAFQDKAQGQKKIAQYVPAPLPFHSFALKEKGHPKTLTFRKDQMILHGC